MVSGTVPVTLLATPVTNGLFTVTLDFGSVAFTGASNWLAIAVRTNSAVLSFIPLAPRQQVTPTPYAITAENALAATTANGFSGAMAGDVTGTQSATTVQKVGGLTAATIVSGINVANGANVNAVAGTVVLRDASAGINAGAIKATGIISGNGSGLTGLSFSQVTNGVFSLAQLAGGWLTNNQTGVVLSGTFAGDGSGLTNLNATNADISGTLVKRDATGSFTNRNLSLDGNLNLPYTTATNGILYAGLVTLLHSYGNANFFAGYAAGNLTMSGSQNTGFGPWTLGKNTGGSQNSASGDQALYNNTTGAGNVANGADALYYNTVGVFNTASGSYALYHNTNGNQNTADGLEALYNNTTGYQNTASGCQALLNNSTGINNTACGNETMTYNTNGNNNTAIGAQALYYSTNGNNNTAAGFEALYANSTGSDNLAGGLQALYNNTTGGNNTADGYQALYGNTNGNNNIALGYQAGYANVSGSGNIDIGNPGTATDNNLIRIGSSQTATYLVGTVYANSVALTSDRNAKENFSRISPQEVLARVTALPVTKWNYKRDARDVRHIGPMAQDFQAAFGLGGADDKHIAVVDESGVALAAIQGLNEKVEAKEARIEAQARQIEALEQSVAALKQLVQGLTPKQ